MIFGKPYDKVQDEERGCVSSLLSRNEVRVTSWRNGQTPMSVAHAKGLLQPRTTAEKAQAAG